MRCTRFAQDKSSKSKESRTVGAVYDRPLEFRHLRREKMREFGSNLQEGIWPLLRGGASARYKKMQRYLNQRAAGRSVDGRKVLHDLPARADSKVALHFA
jgi:hypothetical protein